MDRLPHHGNWFKNRRTINDNAVWPAQRRIVLRPETLVKSSEALDIEPSLKSIMNISRPQTGFEPLPFR
ncbi:hypothetical protein BgiMline_025645 [Biomphalaria glabrata]|nr:hypothetical protein BgiMline_021705 [Biomphalaria glabrata]